VARILVADDDFEQLRLFRMLLEAAGHAVTVTTDPREMLSHLASGEPPQLLVMDLRFPDTRVGLALIRRIREQGWQVPVMILSGWPEELYGQPEEAMVNRILVKPIAAGDLLKEIAELA
jgi:CheY-like chemotaxis protein